MRDVIEMEKVMERKLRASTEAEYESEAGEQRSKLKQEKSVTILDLISDTQKG